VNDPSVAVEPWQEFADQFYKAMQADRKGMWITLFIIILIVAVGVLNTVLMTVLERTREYGVLRAIGVRPFQVTRLVLYEVALMAILSVVVGSALSLAANYYLSVHGFSLPEPIMYGGVEFSRMYSEINLRSFTIPAVTVMLSAILVGIFPAIRAARTEPAKAMRDH
jgi:ABC-type lipoprotein release transport system permease subunit